MFNHRRKKLYYPDTIYQSIFWYSFVAIKVGCTCKVEMSVPSQ